MSSPRTTLLKAVLAAAAVLSLAPAAHAAPTAPDVPTRIAVEDGHKPFLIGHAEGVQIYTCTATGWSSSIPRATLYDDHGKAIISHFAGPSWQAKDGSTVVAGRVDGVTVDPTAIPWLLLKATPVAGPGGDRLSHTTFIQRIATTGGLPPAAADCVSPGAKVEVPYTADYVFWKARGG